MFSCRLQVLIDDETQMKVLVKDRSAICWQSPITLNTISTLVNFYNSCSVSYNSSCEGRCLR